MIPDANLFPHTCLSHPAAEHSPPRRKARDGSPCGCSALNSREARWFGEGTGPAAPITRGARGERSQTPVGASWEAATRRLTQSRAEDDQRYSERRRYWAAPTHMGRKPQGPPGDQRVEKAGRKGAGRVCAGGGGWRPCSSELWLSASRRRVAVGVMNPSEGQNQPDWWKERTVSSLAPLFICNLPRNQQGRVELGNDGGEGAQIQRVGALS